MTAKIFLLLGTNLGNKDQNLEAALQKIDERIGRILRKSSRYATRAWGKSDQPDFYNQVIEVESEFSAADLLGEVLMIEESLGRSRQEKWAERIIDIDILFYGEAIINTERLHIPHPEMVNRRFTLIPLAEIAPDFIHPVYKKNIEALLKDCRDDLAVEKLDIGN